jgi:hypothetical protein
MTTLPEVCNFLCLVILTGVTAIVGRLRLMILVPRERRCTLWEHRTVHSKITVVFMALLPGSQVSSLICNGAVCSGCHESVLVLGCEHSLLERVQALEAELHRGSRSKSTTSKSIALLWK